VSSLRAFEGEARRSNKGGRVGEVIKYQALEEGLEKRKAWEEIFLTAC
jgi:hypothetical protein